MKMKFNANVVCLSMKENESKDGKKFYQISVDQDGEAGTLPITEEVYLNNKATFQKYKPASITCEYNDQYKFCRVVAMTQGLLK